MRGPLRIALTFDVEFNKPSIIRETGSLYSGLLELPGVLEVLRARSVPATWLIAHDTDRENQIARIFPALVDRMAQQGEIGCHFHFHRRRRVRTDEPFVREGIGRATRFLRSLGHAVTSFRGGNSYLDATVVRVLEDLGYAVDSSVVPGLREVSPEGLLTDHTARRRSDPYVPDREDPWRAGDSRILEVPLATDVLLDLRTRLVSVLINRVVGIANLVLSDPDLAARRVDSVRARGTGGETVVVLSAHPYDFLPGGERARLKLERLDRFLGLMGERAGAVFTTLEEIGRRRPEAARQAPPFRSLIRLTTSDLRRARNGLRRALHAGGRRQAGGDA